MQKQVLNVLTTLLQMETCSEQAKKDMIASMNTAMCEAQERAERQRVAETGDLRREVCEAEARTEHAHATNAELSRELQNSQASASDALQRLSNVQADLAEQQCAFEEQLRQIKA